MDEAQTILEMIESVDPADTARLRQIDDAFWSWFGRPVTPPLSPKRAVTRSRDALKAVRLYGFIRIGEFPRSHGDGEPSTGFAEVEPYQKGRCPLLPTEELAELHAIIRAIQFERTKP